MRINSIILRQFRSYGEASFEFDSGVNIIVGPNASGKTNLIEAIAVVARGSGFRAHSDKELIKDDCDWARLDVSLDDNQRRIIKLQRTNSRVTKLFEVGGNHRARLRFEEVIPLTIFEPDHLRLASGGPQRRRDYLDGLLSQLIPTYRRELLAYERVLRQRNSLLKRQAAQSDFFAWEVQLVELASKIVAQRRQLVDQLSVELGPIYSQIANQTTTARLDYGSAVDLDNYPTVLMRRLDANRERDRLMGFTSVGPHRDELLIELGGQPAKICASRGENRTLVLALKILELRLLEQSSQTPPILLLDDVFSELDGSRRKHLTDFFTSHQVFITTTDADMVMKSTAKANFISL